MTEENYKRKKEREKLRNIIKLSYLRCLMVELIEWLKLFYQKLNRKEGTEVPRLHWITFSGRNALPRSCKQSTMARERAAFESYRKGWGIRKPLWVSGHARRPTSRTLRKLLTKPFFSWNWRKFYEKSSEYLKGSVDDLIEKRKLLVKGQLPHDRSEEKGSLTSIKHQSYYLNFTGTENH